MVRDGSVPSPVGHLAELDSVSKAFGEHTAVSRASLSITAGRIHCVCGENGAGKSTLLKMLAGLVAPDEGVIRLGGHGFPRLAPEQAISLGVGMVQQHFALVGALSAVENVVLAAPPHGPLGALRLGPARARLVALLGELGGSVPLDVPVERLGIGDRQRLEIARALFQDARVLVLDEPTSVLAPAEATSLYGTLRTLADRGTGVVVVTHKLDEISAFADDVTVLRRGRVVFTAPFDRSTPAASSAMTGRIERGIMGSDVPAAPLRERSTRRAEPALRVSGLTVGRGLTGVSFEVAAGEIVGVAGVDGNGQRELVRALAAPGGGVVVTAPAPLAPGARPLAPRAAVVHDDRQVEGLVLDAPLWDNALLGEYASFSRLGVLDLVSMKREARTRLEELHVAAGSEAAPDVELPARALSGGNQQKVVVARALAAVKAGARLLVLAHPTRGVDIGAQRTIHQAILDAARSGAGILVVSADLGELRALSDRILVLSRGRIVAELPADASDEALGRAMLGAPPVSTAMPEAPSARAASAKAAS